MKKTTEHLIKFEPIDIWFEKSKKEYDFVDEYLFLNIKLQITMKRKLN